MAFPRLFAVSGVSALLLAVSCVALASADESAVRAVRTLPADIKVREERSVGDYIKKLVSPSVKANKDQSFNIGGLYQYDRQLTTRTVYKSSTMLTVHKEYFTYSSSAVIHCIQIVDLEKTGKNAEVTVQSGGCGQRSVNIRFKSKRGEKINYLVIVWGQ